MDEKTEKSTECGDAEIVYSHNEEEYWDDLDTPVERIVDDPDLTLPARVTLYQAEKKQYAHADFLHQNVADDIIERMQEGAWEEDGEFTEDYLSGSVSPEAKEELRQMILPWVAKHFGQAVPFSTVVPGTVKKISVMVDADGHADESTIEVVS